ncbi:hypothetical protein BH10PSE17_BH10PSE17_13510 [soil metagenome]
MAARSIEAAFVVSGIGSLDGACLRYAGVDKPEALTGELEIVSLAGSLSADGAHLHAVLSTSQGRVLGGHVAPGCTVRTTVELLLAVLPDHRFSREIDPSTGYPELVITTTRD